MATSKNLASGASNGNTASRAGVGARGAISGVANLTKSPTVRSANYVPPVATTPGDRTTKGTAGQLGNNLKNQTGKR